MIVTKPVVEKEVKVKPVKEDRPAPANPQNMNPVTSIDSVNLRSTPTSIAKTDLQYGNINRSSVVQSLTLGIKAALDIPGVIEFTKADAEKIVDVFKETINDAVKTAHVAVQDKNLSSVTVWSPLGMPLRVTAKSNRTSRNPALLAPANELKTQLLEQGKTEDEIAANADYQALLAAWEKSETKVDNKGVSVVKIKEATVSRDGLTVVDAATERAQKLVSGKKAE